MNALATLRRNQAKRANRRARERFLTSAGQWVGMFALIAVTIPAAAFFGYALALSASI